MVARHSHSVSPVTLTFTEQVSPGIFTFGFPRDFPFKAGQVIGIALAEDGARHLYNICSGEDDGAVWIATGTGITPFYSMLRSGKADGKVLIHGNRYLEQFHFYDDFHSAMGEDYIRCCSGETSDGVFHGRVTRYLTGHPGLDPDIKYYLCGSAEMVVDTRDILIDQGIPFDQIISEIYF